MPIPPTLPELPTGPEPVHRDHEASCAVAPINENSTRSEDAGLSPMHQDPSDLGTTRLILDGHRIYNRLEPRINLFELSHPLQLGFPVTVHRTMGPVDYVYIINHAPATGRLSIEISKSTQGRRSTYVFDMMLTEEDWVLTDMSSPMGAFLITRAVNIGSDGTVVNWINGMANLIARESEERLPNDRVVRQLELKHRIISGSEFNILVAAWCATVMHSELIRQNLLKGETETEPPKGKESKNPSTKETKDVDSRKSTSLKGLLKFRRNKSARP